ATQTGPQFASVPLTNGQRMVMRELTIDRMLPRHAEEVSTLFRSVVTTLPYYNHVAKQSELAKYTPDLLRRSIDTEPDSVLVAQTNAEIIGFCLSRSDDGLIWLAWFGVHPAHRRKGIGSALLGKLEETVRNGRSHKIWCDCRTENH